MPVALNTAGLPSQPRQGVGARIVRRLGGAVRSVIGSGINLAAALRRPAVPQTSRNYAAAQAPAPSRVPVPQRPRAALSAPLLLPRWLAAPLLARRHHRPAAAIRRAYRDRHDTPFTPQAFPQLSPRACAVLNTPLKDCDPKTLELVFSTFAQHIGELMSPEARITDPQAILPNLWHRISTVLGDTNADTSLPATPRAVSATPADPPRPSPLPLSGPPASDQPAAPTTAAPQTPPNIAAPSAPVVHRSRSFRYHTQSSTRWRRCDSQPSLPSRIRVYLCASVVPFSCCHYAASTGPP